MRYRPETKTNTEEETEVERQKEIFISACRLMDDCWPALLTKISFEKKKKKKKKLDQSKKKKFEKKIGSVKVYQFNEPTQYVGERHLNLETNGERK
jgi:hypothetical protein